MVINSHIASCSAQAVRKLRESVVQTVGIALHGEQLRKRGQRRKQISNSLAEWRKTKSDFPSF